MIATTLDDTTSAANLVFLFACIAIVLLGLYVWLKIMEWRSR